MKQLKIILALAKIASKQYLEHRIGTAGSIFNSILSLATTLLIITIIFNLVKDLNGWTKAELFLILGISRIQLTVFSAIFQRGINKIPESVNIGELDLLLTKPINSQLLVSFRYPKVYELINTLTGIILTFYALQQLRLQFDFWAIAILVAALICGQIIFYSIYFSLATLSFWIGRFYSFPDFFLILSNPMSYPSDIYTKPMDTILTYFVPIGLVVTVPIKIFLEKSPLYFLAIEFALTVLFLTFSIWWWNISLKRYSSASS